MPHELFADSDVAHPGEDLSMGFLGYPNSIMPLQMGSEGARVGVWG